LPLASDIPYITELYHTLSRSAGGVKNLLCALLSHPSIKVLLYNKKSEVIREVTEEALVTNSRVSLGYP